MSYTLSYSIQLSYSTTVQGPVGVPTSKAILGIEYMGMCVIMHSMMVKDAFDCSINDSHAELHVEALWCKCQLYGAISHH